MTIKELLHRKGQLHEQMKAIVDAADKEQRKLNAEEEQKFNSMDSEMEALSADIERRERLANVEKSLSAPVNEPKLHTTRSDDRNDDQPTPEDAKKLEERKMEAFTNWLRFGMEGIKPEHRAIMARSRSFNLTARDIPSELRAQAVGTGSAGGYLVPQGFSNELEKALKAYGGVRSVARSEPTPTGQDIPWPTVDDTSNVGELLAENASAASQDVTFGQIVLKAYKYSSKVVLVPLELLQDSYFDVNTLLRDLLAERIGRITNTHFTTGTGSSQPKGCVTEAGSGKVGTTGQTTSVIYDDIVDLEHSVDPLYRPGSVFMMADGSLKVIKKIKDTTGRPIWMPGLVSGQPNTINGYPYVINQDVAAMAANAKSILFGNFSRYIVRDVMDITLLRLVERYAEVGQVGFIAFSRHDGRSINSSALKYYQNSAS